MKREEFIRKWLANPQKQYNEQCRDEMRDDLDSVIEHVNKQLHKTNVSSHICPLCGDDRYEADIEVCHNATCKLTPF